MQVLAGWRDELVQLRQERALERLKEDNLAFKAKSDESVRRTISMMLGGQSDLLLKEAWAGWRDEVVQFRQDEVLRTVLKNHNQIQQASGPGGVR